MESASSLMGINNDNIGPDEDNMSTFGCLPAEKTFFFLATTKEVLIFVA